MDGKRLFFSAFIDVTGWQRSGVDTQYRLRDVGVGGSNPLTPTNKINDLMPVPQSLVRRQPAPLGARWRADSRSIAVIATLPILGADEHPSGPELTATGRSVI